MTYTCERCGAGTDALPHARCDTTAAEMRSEIARLRAALAAERDTCQGFYSAGTKTHNSIFGTEANIHAETYWRAWEHQHARRAARIVHADDVLMLLHRDGHALQARVAQPLDL